MLYEKAVRPTGESAMQLYDILATAQDGKAVENLAAAYGIRPEQAEAVMRAVLPEVSRRIERNTFSRGGLADMVGALGAAQQSGVLDDPQAMARPSTQQLGVAFLDQILGSKDRSRAVAARAAASTGISEALIRQMLPVVISMIVGALAKGGGGALGDIIARIPGLGGAAPQPSGRSQRAPSGGSGYDIPPLPAPLPEASGSGRGFETGGGVGGGYDTGQGGGFGGGQRGGYGNSPLPIPGDDIPALGGGPNPYGDLSDIIRKGGPAVVAGGGLFAIIRSLLGTLLGFQSRGIVGWLVRLVVMRWGWGLLKSVLGRLVLGRR